MAIDKLQERIRKMKSPLAVDMMICHENIPVQYTQTHINSLDACAAYTRDLLLALNKSVAAVKFDFGFFALMGAKGLEILEEQLRYARQLGYYVLLNAVEPLSGPAAEQAAQLLFSDNCNWYFDGLILTAYIGSDALLPFISKLKDSGKDLFVVGRTANKTASETQDLLTGSRLAHIAKVDIVNRYTEQLLGKCAYSQVAVVAAGSSPDSLKTIRTKYKSVFILIDGCDYPNANAKNCSNAFDRLGHGALACAGLSVTAAWKEEDIPSACMDAAVAAAERLKKNLLRYVTIL